MVKKRRVVMSAMVFVLGVACVLGSSSYAQTAKVVSRPLTPREIKNQIPSGTTTNLPTGTQKSYGLNVVGVGQPAYLEVEITNNTMTVTSVVWRLVSKPGASALAGLADSPLTNLTTWPIYDPGARAARFIPTNQTAMKLDGRSLLMPDKPGQYVVAADVLGYKTTNAISLSATNTITVGTYVGIDSACEYCHNGNDVAVNNNVEGWLETAHANALTRKIDNDGSQISSLSCIECHSVGYDTSVAATNGGFDDVRIATGWTFPAVRTNGNWDAMPPELQAKGNIQCENCHGPASQHWQQADTNKIDVSISVGACAWCHDSGTHHVRPFEWAQSGHSHAPRRLTSPCNECHTGSGFIDKFDGDGKVTKATLDEGVTCATCHDPHSDANASQLRTVADVALGATNEPVATVTGGGAGMICMQCHKSRHSGAVEALVYSSRFGPHHSPQADMLAGVNAADYSGMSISAPLNPHLTAVADTCAGCHMQNIEGDATFGSSYMYAGGHTMKMTATNGVDVTKACLPCHVTDTFDLKYRVDRDYDNDGNYAEGVQTEVAGLMEQIAIMLPPAGTNTITLTSAYTPAQLKALYNMRFVEYDGSQGVHNPGYAIGLLKAAIADLQADALPKTRQIFLQQAAGQVQAWTVDTNGLRTASQTLYSGATAWLLRGAGDINKDGIADLIWQLPAGQVACWFMNTNGAATSSSLLYWGTTTWEVRAAGDIDKDGIADLIWQLPTGQVSCWFMNANGTVKSTKTISSVASAWKVRAAGDIDKDKVADLIWQLPTGQAACWLMNANGTLKQGITVLGSTTPWVIRGAGDINWDGAADLVWQLPTGQIVGWLMNTNATRNAGVSIQTAATDWQVRGLGN